MNQIQRNRIWRIQTISWKSYSTINLWEDHFLGIDHIRKIINRASVRSFDHHILFTKWKSHRYFAISRFENHMKVNKLQCFMRVSEYHFRSAVKNSSLRSHGLCHHRTLHKLAFWDDVPSPEIRYSNKIKYVSPVIPAERWTESGIDRHLSSMKIWEKKKKLRCMKFWRFCNPWKRQIVRYTSRKSVHLQVEFSRNTDDRYVLDEFLSMNCIFPYLKYYFNFCIMMI